MRRVRSGCKGKQGGGRCRGKSENMVGGGENGGRVEGDGERGKSLIQINGYLNGRFKILQHS